MSTTSKKGLNFAAAPDVGAREEEGTVVHLRDECDELMFDGETPVTITVVGEYSPTYRKAQAEISRANVKAARIDPDAALDNAIASQVRLAAACVKSWSGIRNGEQEFPCTRENAEALLGALPHVYKQVDRAITDHARFFRKS